MRNRYFLLLDLPIIWISALTAFVLRFDMGFMHYRREFLFFLLAATVVKPLVFQAVGIYRRYWRYASIADAPIVLVAAVASSSSVAMVLVASLWAGVLETFSRSVVVIDFLVTFVLVAGVRVASRALAETPNRAAAGRGPGKRVLIAGAGEAGIIVARDLQRNPQLGFRAIGFLDDDPAKLNKRIANLPVFGRLGQLVAIAETRRVDEVVIAMPTAPGSVIRAVAEQCRAVGLTSRAIPGVFELVGGQVTIGRLRDIQITDLLRRSHARPAFDAHDYITGRNVIVTGAGGSIGQEVCRQVAALRPGSLVLLGHGENSLFEAQAVIERNFPQLSVSTVVADVRDADRLMRVFQRAAPDVVFHAAAHKHVPLMEQNPVEAFTNNSRGMLNVLRAVMDTGTERLVFISTDKAAAPVSIMGASKRLAEELVRQTAERFERAFMVVRFGNVLGSRGSAVPVFQKQIEEGGPITITHPEMTRYFMTIPEAAHLVLEAGGIGRGGELFVLRMGDPIRIVDLARDLIRLSGTREDVPIVFTGIRPGEKLHETLWEPGAEVESTVHPDIVRVRERPVAPGVDWPAAVEQIASLAAIAPRADLVRELARYLPTFAAEAGRQAHA